MVVVEGCGGLNPQLIFHDFTLSSPLSSFFTITTLLSVPLLCTVCNSVVSLLSVVLIGPSMLQSCPVTPVGDIRDLRDCYPWSGVNQSVCEGRGCSWCPNNITNAPPCVYNDDVCPSLIPESSRVDCLPEGGLRQTCLQKRCIWCPTSTSGNYFLRSLILT